MTAATETNYLQIPNPNMEVVQLTVSDGETWTSKKFAKVTHAVVSGNEDVDAHVNAVTAGTGVVTINYAGASDKKVTLVCFGKLGN